MKIRLQHVSNSSSSSFYLFAKDEGVFTDREKCEQWVQNVFGQYISTPKDVWLYCRECEKYQISYVEIAQNIMGDEEQLDVEEELLSTLCSLQASRDVAAKKGKKGLNRFEDLDKLYHQYRKNICKENYRKFGGGKQDSYTVQIWKVLDFIYSGKYKSVIVIEWGDSHGDHSQIGQHMDGHVYTQVEDDYAIIKINNH